MGHVTVGGRDDGDGLTLGLSANWRQFWLLVVVNAFVGSMVGLERTVVPLMAEAEFGIVSASALLSVIATFGIVKAAPNFFAGHLGDRYGRKRVLVAGWLIGVPVPFLVMWAPTWEWIVAANVLLGLNQGLAWSTTVIMKIDLVGPKRRGFAMGLNEFAGYVAVALAALATGYIAEIYGLRPEPFYGGVAIVAVGLGLSLIFVRDTRQHVEHETAEFAIPAEAGDAPPRRVTTSGVFALATWRHPALYSASQAGLVNNLNDGLAWGIFPLLFASAGLDLAQIGMLGFVYPAVWGVFQLWTGGLSDRLGRKWLIVGGMVLQGLALFAISRASGFWPWMVGSTFLGVGTAMVYPTLLASVGDVAHPSWRGSAVGVYRFWRDSGYAVGALLAGVMADWFSLGAAVTAAAILTIASGVFVWWRMPETAPEHRPAPHASGAL